MPIESRFKPATRKKLRLRMGLAGPSGSGKSYSGLRFAHALVSPEGRIAGIDSEHESLSKYQGHTTLDGVRFDFDVAPPMKSYDPMAYVDLIDEAGQIGYEVLLIDGLSQAWEGVGGALDQVDKSGDTNRYTAWKDVTPRHRRLIDAMLSSPCHIIATLRTKMEYVLEPNDKGKLVPRKVGTKPIQREGMEYEFDVFADIDQGHRLYVTKSRCPEIQDLEVQHPGAQFMRPLIEWLNTGEVLPESMPARLATGEQAQEFARLTELQGKSLDEMRNALQGKYGKGDFLELTAGEAAEVLARMREKIEQRRKEK